MGHLWQWRKFASSTRAQERRLGRRILGWDGRASSDVTFERSDIPRPMRRWKEKDLTTLGA